MFHIVGTATEFVEKIATLGSYYLCQVTTKPT